MDWLFSKTETIWKIISIVAASGNLVEENKSFLETRRKHCDACEGKVRETLQTEKKNKYINRYNKKFPLYKYNTYFLIAR